jgi:hypothetical protein
MHHRNILNHYASIIIEVLEIVIGERGSHVGNDAIGQAKAVNDFIEQLGYLLCSFLD